MITTGKNHANRSIANTEWNAAADLERFDDVDDNMIGRVALVVGGTEPIGSAVCHTLASRGAAIAVGFGSKNPGGARELALDLRRRYNSSATIHEFDLGSADDCRRLIGDVIQRHGRLDILVNNVGFTIDKPVLELTEDDWDQELSANLSGSFYLSREVLGHMVARGTGRIINIASAIVPNSDLTQTNFISAEFGLSGLTKTLAREAAAMMEDEGKLTEYGPGITVNAITSGYIKTDASATVADDVLHKIPLHRLGYPAEIARVVHFIAADGSSYITGQVLGVNGGVDM